MESTETSSDGATETDIEPSLSHDELSVTGESVRQGGVGDLSESGDGDDVDTDDVVEPVDASAVERPVQTGEDPPITERTTVPPVYEECTPGLPAYGETVISVDRVVFNEAGDVLSVGAANSDDDYHQYLSGDRDVLGLLTLLGAVALVTFGLLSPFSWDVLFAAFGSTVGCLFACTAICCAIVPGVNGVSAVRGHLRGEPGHSLIPFFFGIVYCFFISVVAGSVFFARGASCSGYQCEVVVAGMWVLIMISLVACGICSCQYGKRNPEMCCGQPRR